MEKWLQEIPFALVRIGKTHKGFKYPIVLLLLAMDVIYEGCTAVKALAHPQMRRRMLAGVMSLCMVFTLLPIHAFAAAPAKGTDVLCEHHTAHTRDCGYVETVPGRPCKHEHTASCYSGELSCELDEIVEKPASGSHADHVHTQECYTLDCQHEHDNACGYTEAVKGQLCSYTCEICAQDSEEDSEEEAEAKNGDATNRDATAGYNQADIDVVNEIIKKNKLDATESDPENWSFAYWDNSTPRRIDTLALNGSALTGELNVSALVKLTLLQCSKNKLTGLNVTGLTELTDLNCSGNGLNTLDVTGLTKLNNLDCSENALKELNVSSLTALNSLYCSGNQLQALNVSSLTNLWGLYCGGNALTELEGLSSLKKLEYLYCDKNQMAELDLSSLKKLTELSCYQNQLTKLNISGLTELKKLECYENQLTGLNLTGLKKLTEVKCHNNPIASFKLSEDNELTVVSTAAGTVALTDYNHGTKSVSLTAANNAGSIFRKWTATGTNLTNNAANPVTFPFYGKITVTPVFTDASESPITIKVNDNPTGVVGKDIVAAVTASGVAVTDIKKLTVTAGAMTEADWKNLGTLSGLQHFTIEEAVIVVDIPDKGSYEHNIVSILPKNIVSVTVPQEIKIGESAFAWCQKLTSVNLPNATAIGKEAFRDCIKLTSITIPGGITRIGENAFIRCEGLKSVTIQEGVTRIGNRAFGNCKTLKSVTIPKSVTRIEEGAFQACNALTSVTIPGEEIVIDKWAFNSCKELTAITIPAKTAKFEEEAFMGSNKLSTLSLGATPPKVYDYNVFFEVYNGPRYLAFVDENGIPLTGEKLDQVREVYKNDKGNENKPEYRWFGWIIADPTITSVTLNEKSMIKYDNQWGYFTAAVEGKYNAEKTVTWTLTGAKKAETTLNAKGELYIAKGEAPSTLTVTATSTQDPSKSDSCTVQVKETVSKPKHKLTLVNGTVFTMSGNISDIEEDEAVWLEADMPPAGYVFNKWVSTDDSIFDLFHGISDPSTRFLMPGHDLTITATYKDPNSKETVDTVTVTPASATIKPGATQQFTALVSGTNSPAQTVIWTVTGAERAETNISNEGLLTIAANETAKSLTVKATSTADTDKSGTAAVTVSSQPVSTTHIIMANAGAGGSISPDGYVSVANGADQTFTFTPNSGYRIAGTLVDGINLGTINEYTFKNVTKTHTITVAFVKIDSGGGSSGGSSGSSSGGGTVTPPTPPAQNKPVTGETTVTAPVDQNGNVNATVSDQAVADAIKAAQDAVNKDNPGGTIDVQIKVETDKAATQLTLNMPKSVLEAFINNKVDSVIISSNAVNMSFSKAAIEQINNQAKENITIAAAQTDTAALTGDARTAIGSRPAFSLTVSAAGGEKISSFGAGSVSVAIPYTPDANENAGNIQAVYVDDNGNVEWLQNSVYDSVNKVLHFGTSHFSIYGVGYRQESPDYTDLGDHWAKADIEFVVNRGLLTNTGETTFSPDTAMTRGMFVTALGRLANADVSGYTQSSFPDVANDAYYMGYTQWANENGIVNGGTDGRFQPDEAVTREQMAVIMSNYAKATGFTTPNVHAENTFADSDKISAHARDTVKQMQMAGILAGKNGNVFDPQGTATRAEASAVLHRFVELAVSGDTAQGFTTNDSGQRMYYENGKPVTGQKTIDGTAYTFDQYGVTADVPKNKKYGTYTVQKGDSFWKISRKFGCTMSELEQLNNKSRYDIIYPGDVLSVPEK